MPSRSVHQACSGFEVIRKTGAGYITELEANVQQQTQRLIRTLNLRARETLFSLLFLLILTVDFFKIFLLLAVFYHDCYPVSIFERFKDLFTFLAGASSQPSVLTSAKCGRLEWIRRDPRRMMRTYLFHRLLWTVWKSKIMNFFFPSLDHAHLLCYTCYNAVADKS